jgi:hypothetical protein
MWSFLCKFIKTYSASLSGSLYILDKHFLEGIHQTDTIFKNLKITSYPDAIKQEGTYKTSYDHYK